MLVTLALLGLSCAVSGAAHTHSHSHGSDSSASAPPRWVDLHTHSTQSDGTLSPLSLVRLAASLGLHTIAWTDHDQLAFSPTVQHEAQRLGVQLLKGVEISTEWRLHSIDRGVKAHLLGYWVRDDPSSELFSMLSELREKRHERNLRIIDQLQQQHNIHITPQQVLRQKQDKEETNDTQTASPRLDYVGRPHFARVLVAEKHAASIKDAFNRYLSDEQLQAPEWSIDIARAIRALDDHGGVAVLAHPSTLNLTATELHTELTHLLHSRHLPLTGLEAYSSRHTAEQAQQYSDLAERLGLIVTGGSDFHGKNKADVELGQFGGGNDEWKQRGAAALELLRQRMESRMSRDEFAGLLMNVVLHLSTYCMVIGMLLMAAHVYQRGSPQTSVLVEQLHKTSVLRWTFAARDSNNSSSNSNGSNALIRRASRATPADRSIIPAPGAASTNTDNSNSSTAPATTARGTHGLSKPLHFLFCFCGLQASYLTWGYLQERIMTGEYDGDKFSTSEWLVCTNRVSAVILAATVMWWQQRQSHYNHKQSQHPHRTSGEVQPLLNSSDESDNASTAPSTSPTASATSSSAHQSIFQLHCPPYKYMLCSLTNILSSWLQYESLHYVSFPLQVLSKSSKILFTMLMGRLVSHTHYSLFAYFQAGMIALGLLLYRRSESQWDSGRILPTYASEVGLLLLLGYMCADSFTSTWQSKIFKEVRDCSELEMMLGMNVFSSVFTMASLVCYNQLLPSLWFTWLHPLFMLHCVLMSFCSAIGQLFIFHTIATHGAVAFASIMTARQLLSLVLSVLVFGHGIGWDGVFGLVLVFVSLMLKIREDLYKKERGKVGIVKVNVEKEASGYVSGGGGGGGKEKRSEEEKEHV